MRTVSLFPGDTGSKPCLQVYRIYSSKSYRFLLGVTPVPIVVLNVLVSGFEHCISAKKQTRRVKFPSHRSLKMYFCFKIIPECDMFRDPRIFCCNYFALKSVRYWSETVGLLQIAKVFCI